MDWCVFTYFYIIMLTVRAINIPKIVLGVRYCEMTLIYRCMCNSASNTEILYSIECLYAASIVTKLKGKKFQANLTYVPNAMNLKFALLFKILWEILYIVVTYILNENNDKFCLKKSPILKMKQWLNNQNCVHSKHGISGSS